MAQSIADRVPRVRDGGKLAESSVIRPAQLSFRSRCEVSHHTPYVVVLRNRSTAKAKRLSRSGARSLSRRQRSDDREKRLNTSASLRSDRGRNGPRRMAHRSIRTVSDSLNSLVNLTGKCPLSGRSIG